MFPYEDEELRRAQETYNRLTADARENDNKRMKLQLAPSIPKVMKNDIRRYYSKMFMNTMNSADFINIQNYYNTFMCGPCKFVTEHAVNPEFSIPKLMVACGPRVMAHYTLGCFVMFPDMTMIMSDSRIVTSNSWTGTKIVMDMEIRATKSSDIDMSDWIPQISELEQMYKTAQQEKVLSTMAVTDVNGANVCAAGTDVAQPSQPRKAVTAGCDTDADCSQGPTQSYAAITTAAVAAVESATTTSGSCKRKVDEMDDMSTSSRSTTSSVSSYSSTSSHHSNGSEHNSHKSNTSNSSYTSTSSHSTTSTISANGNMDLIAPQDYRQSYIPESYIQALFGRARPRATPQQILIKGEIILYLDENNHIQHIKQSMVQKSSKGWGGV